MSWQTRLELKVPPALSWCASALVMWLGADSIPRSNILHHPILALLFAAAGLLVALLGVAAFRRESTTIDPRFPHATRALVTAGVYRFSRNPMYLGMLLVLIGWGFWLGGPMPFTVVLGFVLFLNRWQIEPEERALRQIFSTEFTAYCQRVRRWI